MAKTGLRVFIGDLETQVGTLWFESLGNREHSIFQYEESWVSHPRRFAIAPHIPLDGGRMFFKAAGEHASPLPLPIADTTPDAWGRSIIRKDSKGAEKPTSPLTEIDFLTSVDDFSRVGALRFRSMTPNACWPNSSS